MPKVVFEINNSVTGVEDRIQLTFNRSFTLRVDEPCIYMISRGVTIGVFILHNNNNMNVEIRVRGRIVYISLL